MNFPVGLACAAALLLATACAPDPIPEPTQERYEACLEGYECAVQCPDPAEALTELGCAPGDFNSEPPDCPLTDNCANAKADCFESCNEMFPGEPPSQDNRDCKIQCDIDYGNDSTCKEDFQVWLDERAEVLSDYRDCLVPCEGTPTRVSCAMAEPGECDTIQGARHKAVSQVETCAVQGGETCEWSCDDPTNNYYVED